MTAVALAAGILGVSAAEPVAMFDGETLGGWTDGAGKAVEPGGWVVEDGCLHRKGRGGDLFSEKEYGDFVLEFEWKVAPGGNSGVKYRVAKFGGAILGMEYQVLDDAGHGNGKVAKTSAASFYDVLAPAADKELKPVGEFNQSKIVARGSKFEHWLNGEKVLEFDTSTEAFGEALARSKFRNAEGFARNPKGRILIQDHGDPVWFRNIRITELAPE